jgi:Ca2+/Na+ antiporter
MPGLVRDRQAPSGWAPVVLAIALVLGIVAALATFSIVEEERETRRFVYAVLFTGFAALRLFLPKRSWWDRLVLVLFGALAALAWAYYFELVPDGAVREPAR